ncbi:MAG: 50S ribosomal protein L23 [Patescibacteria group bacterium]|nr:50S ribosomal protein L23 [Patescibacteria group bacterium]
MSTLGHQTQSVLDVLVSPYITEKASRASSVAFPVYTFKVAPRATKPMVIQAIKEKYKVTPIKVNMINLHPKKKRIRGRIGYTSAVRKALVYLKSGDKIE